jgi:uncharacterized membrane protein
MRCANCGVEMIAGAAFCPSCGKPIGPAAAGPSGTAVASPGSQTNVTAALCYLAGLVTGILFLVLEPYRHDRFIRFHAWQSIFLSLAWFAAYFLVLGLFLTILPGMLWRLTWLLHAVLALGFFSLWLLLIYKAYNHEQFQLPIIGDLAKRQA